MSAAGSVSVADDGTVTKSGLAGNYYDAIYAQESPLFPNRLVKPDTFSGTQTAWTQRIDAALVKVKKSFARTANAMANGAPMGASAFVEQTTDTGNVAAGAYATLLTANITTVLAASFLLINFSAAFVNSVQATVYFKALVDGVEVVSAYSTVSLAGGAANVPMVGRKAVTPGAHTVLIQWKTGLGNVHINATSIPEEHASLWVQEVG